MYRYVDISMYCTVAEWGVWYLDILRRDGARRQLGISCSWLRPGWWRGGRRGRVLGSGTQSTRGHGLVHTPAQHTGSREVIADMQRVLVVNVREDLGWRRQISTKYCHFDFILIKDYVD